MFSLLSGLKLMVTNTSLKLIIEVTDDMPTIEVIKRFFLID